MLPLMPSETPAIEPSERGDFILATYKEIAQRFGLGGPNAARTKAKRAGWAAETPNHPVDPLHIRVPRDAWDQTGETLHRTSRERGHSKARETPSQTDESPHINALQEHIATLRERLAEAEKRLAREAGRADREAGRADAAEAELRAEREAARRLGEEIAKLAGDVARLAAAQEKGADTPAARWRRRVSAWLGRP